MNFDELEKQLGSALPEGMNVETTGETSQQELTLTDADDGDSEETDVGSSLELSEAQVVHQVEDTQEIHETETQDASAKQEIDSIALEVSPVSQVDESSDDSANIIAEEVLETV